MKRKLLLTILTLFMLSVMAIGCPRAPRLVEMVHVEPPEGPYPGPPKEWSVTFGGPYRDQARSAQQTACGGFIIAGTTDSFGAGDADFWLVKTDPQGNKLWSQTFGGAGADEAYSVEQIACGGFIIAGRTESFGEGLYDVWLVKTDPQGNKEWSRTFGGVSWDSAFSVQQTACGGFIIAGTTWSFGEGKSDVWLIKTDPQGNKKWSQTFGGPYWDGTHRLMFVVMGYDGLAVQQTACGGFIVIGTTRGDVWLIKTDPEGNKEWSQTFGGPKSDAAMSVQQTACGGFIVAGTTESFGAGNSDFWVIKTDAQGNKEWSQTFGGGPGWEHAFSIQQTGDGGFIVAGSLNTVWMCHSRPLGVVPLKPYMCIWVVKTDAHGNLEWTQTFGTLPQWDIARSVKQTACGGFIIAGWTESYGEGESDFWLIKLAPPK